MIKPYMRRSTQGSWYFCYYKESPTTYKFVGVGATMEAAYADFCEKGRIADDEELILTVAEVLDRQDPINWVSKFLRRILQ